jgi:SAM-dependent methyltransferase
VDDADRDGTQRIRSLISRGELRPSAFRRALLDISPIERDAWLDRLLQLEPIPDDAPDLPRGCVPYLPCAVDSVLRAVELAGVGPGDVFVDLGSGAGRTLALVALLTGASVVGVEIQPQLVQASRRLQARLNLGRFKVVEADAAAPPPSIGDGTVFFLYCPFGQDRLQTLLTGLERVAAARELRVCAVDLPLPSRPWLTPVSSPNADCAVYRSTGRVPYALAEVESRRA